MGHRECQLRMHSGYPSKQHRNAVFSTLTRGIRRMLGRRATITSKTIVENNQNPYIHVRDLRVAYLLHHRGTQHIQQANTLSSLETFVALYRWMQNSPDRIARMTGMVIDSSVLQTKTHSSEILDRASRRSMNIPA